MKTCYRVENVEGYGPYQYFISDKWDQMKNFAFDHGFHPMPRFCSNSCHFFAFNTLGKLEAWFTSPMRKELAKHGFVIHVSKVEKFSNADSIQIQFDRDESTLFKTIPLY